MSTAQNVKTHPAVLQAQNKANYYVGQLDKEVKTLIFLVIQASWISHDRAV